MTALFQFLAVTALGLVVAGCAGGPPPETIATRPKTICEKVADGLANPGISQSTKMVAIEVGRNNGCFGQPQTQKIEIDQTIRVVPR